MRRTHLPGTEALRVEVFMPDMNPDDARRASKFIGSRYDLSLIIWHDSEKKSPGGVVEPSVCYQLFMHDNVTAGGILIADSCQVTEYFLDNAVVSDVAGDVITLTMNNGQTFVLDLTPMLAKYNTMVRDNNDGTFTFVKNSVDVETWVNGALFSINASTNSLVIVAGNGVIFSVPLDTWAFTKSSDGKTLTIYKNGAVELSFQGGGATETDFEAIYEYVNNAITTAINNFETDFEGGSTVSFAEGSPEGNYTLTINGVANNFDVGVVSIVKPTDVTYLATLADGTTVGWAAPQNVMYLNDPVIYLRQATGTISPPIASQDDLTEANAFSSFNAIKNFLTTCQVSGTITIDAQGTFSLVSFTADSLFGGTALHILGDETDPSALTFSYGAGAVSFRDGLTASDKLIAYLADCTFHNAGLDSGNTVSNNSAGITVTGGAVVSLGGTIAFTGASSATQKVFRATDNGRLTTYSAHGTNMKLDLQMELTGTIASMFLASTNSSYVMLNTQFSRTETTPLTVTDGICMIDTASSIEFKEFPQGSFETVFTHGTPGTNFFTGPTFVLRKGSYMAFTGIEAVDFPHSAIATWFRNSNTATRSLDATCAVSVDTEDRFGPAGTTYS